MNNSGHQAIREFFQNRDDFVISSHIRPDGDAVGSVIAFGHAFEAIGKKSQLVLGEGVPRAFKFLEGVQNIKRDIKPGYGAMIAVDCSDINRLGSKFADLIPDLNIDHHITNEHFAPLNFVNSEASATCEILTEFFPAWGLPITPKVANALLTGILNDTIGFKTPNVTAKTLRLTADLVELGGDLSDIYAISLDTHSYEALKYWEQGISNLTKEGQMVWTTLSLENRQSANYPGNDDADLINLLSSIEDAVLSVIFIEQGNGTVKVSWRAKPGWDVSKIAMNFGGGGHKAAAGAEIGGPLEKIKTRVISATKLLLNETNNP